jgi:Tol biopolymer transport system component
MDRTGKTQTLVASPGLYYSPRFSPDGKHLAFSVNLVSLQVYDWQRDTTARLTTGGPANSPVWTPDGNHIVFATLSAAVSSLRWIRSDGAQEGQTLLDRRIS